MDPRTHSYRSVGQRVKPGGTIVLFDLHGDPSKTYFKLFYSAWIRYMDLRGYTGKKKERLLKRLEAGIAYVGRRPDYGDLSDCRPEADSPLLGGIALHRMDV